MVYTTNSGSVYGTGSRGGYPGGGSCGGFSGNTQSAPVPGAEGLVIVSY